MAVIAASFTQIIGAAGSGRAEKCAPDDLEICEVHESAAVEIVERIGTEEGVLELIEVAEVDNTILIEIGAHRVIVVSFFRKLSRQLRGITQGLVPETGDTSQRSRRNGSAAAS